MLEFKNEDITIREFNLTKCEFEIYLTWLRDLETIASIGHNEYFLSIDYDSIREYTKNLNQSKTDSLFSVYYKEILIGTLKIGHINWRTLIGDVGIMIGNKDYRGKGLSTQIIELGCMYGFDILGLNKLSGGTFSTNYPMCRCFEKVGFKKEGSIRKSLFFMGKYCNHELYGILREEYYDRNKMFYENNKNKNI